MPSNLLPESLMYAVYFAPRGKERLLNLGHQIAQRHLSPQDKLIGLVGDSGAGKSLLIRGMFPGLELSSDDEGVRVRPLPLLANGDKAFFSSHTYHVDFRFESAFTQPYVLVEAIREAVEQGKRVVVEHFELVYPQLGMNAEMLIGIGEEVIVTRPSIFGPKPGDLAEIVFQSIHSRKMAHTAEDIVCKILEAHCCLEQQLIHADVKNGFVLEFSQKPQIDLKWLEGMAKEYIQKNLPVSYVDDEHIKIGDELLHCTGPRIHVKNTSEIDNFRLLHEFWYDPIHKVYALVGLVGRDKIEDLKDLNKLGLYSDN
ncbi:MAG: alanine-tRNA synthetase second additional domain-containing protein [Firmicutes bacterium]|nr:alanine-tRNA synthetase second additional domain-containing protein [Bacillota bacterium]